MPLNPEVIVFDVNETLSDLTGLDTRIEETGAPPELLRGWFAAVLREGFALTCAGGFAEFADVAAEELRLRLLEVWDPVRAQDAARHIVDGFGSLSVHPDVPDGVRRLHDHGFRLMTMTNGAASSTEALLAGAGLRDRFEALLDVQGPRAWKPARAAYHHALRRAGVPAGQVMLVAVHPWDIDGARRAGLAGAWLRRTATDYPRYMTPATYTAADLTDLATRLTGA
ncbi:haloacid dehalogenase type II [Streptomyces sp. NRRL F-5126]|uniref:haloacid dehalogenase type II n=1 Tax=Streptomyces sp. NRRL F-5126 TaxID=1463857 RepID=UPI0004C5A851|nr:haloacid dehalogenase type II [Streptomyces sp. NRRL F-5126]